MGETNFEAGQVLAVDIYGDGGDAPLLVREVNASSVVTSDLRCVGVEVRLHPEEMTEKPKVTSPAPKPGQHWESDGYVKVQIVDGDDELVAENWNNGSPVCRGSVVDVAQWLAEFGFKCVTGNKANPEIRSGDSESLTKRSSQVITAAELNQWSIEATKAFSVSLPPLPVGQFIVSVDFQNRRVSVRGQDGELLPEIATTLVDASSEEFVTAEATQPAPSKFAQVPLATSRRLVDEAVKTLRGEPFANAIQATLISLCGDRLEFGPRQVDIQAAINACQAWEYARGKVAPGKRTLSAAEHRELTETAKIAAWGAGIAMQDASDIGEIVSETYERVRATC